MRGRRRGSLVFSCNQWTGTFITLLDGVYLCLPDQIWILRLPEAGSFQPTHPPAERAFLVFYVRACRTPSREADRLQTMNEVFWCYECYEILLGCVLRTVKQTTRHVPRSSGRGRGACFMCGKTRVHLLVTHVCVGAGPSRCRPVT